MTFAYFARLNRSQQATYRRSDAVTSIDLPDAERLRPLALEVAAALAREDRELTQAATERLAGGLARALGVPGPLVQVLAARPHARWGELHGLYTPARGRAPSRITVWMRTARRRQVVAFRTFLRTLLHEICHHLDYRLLGLPDSFHTEGFYKRESSLLHQLVPASPTEPARRTMNGAPGGGGEWRALSSGEGRDGGGFPSARRAPGGPGSRAPSPGP